MSRTLTERLWSKVDVRGPDDCWMWTASTRTADRGSGYGQFWANGKKCGPHVIALELATGESANGRNALHSCDTPLCINPAHLSWGTQSQNVQQAYDRGRRTGVTKPRSLTQTAVDEIRRRYAAGGIPQVQLAAEFGVGQPLISQIISRHRWGKAA